MPDDHPNSIGTLGFMRHDYVNFGFDNADVVIAVGYELQEFDPVRINPKADKKIIHIHRFPAEVDAHYSVDVGIIGDISASLDALDRGARRPRLRRPIRRSPAPVCSTRNSLGDNRIRATRWRPRGWSPTPGPRWAAATSCWSTPVPPRCGWPGSTRPTSATPA